MMHRHESGRASHMPSEMHAAPIVLRHMTEADWQRLTWERHHRDQARRRMARIAALSGFAALLSLAIAVTC